MSVEEVSLYNHGNNLLHIVCNGIYVLNPSSHLVWHLYFAVSDAFGFGLLDAGAMVKKAVTWRNLPPLVECTVLERRFERYLLHILKMECLLSSRVSQLSDLKQIYET